MSSGSFKSDRIVAATAITDSIAERVTPDFAVGEQPFQSKTDDISLFLQMILWLSVSLFVFVEMVNTSWNLGSDENGFSVTQVSHVYFLRRNIKCFRWCNDGDDDIAGRTLSGQSTGCLIENGGLWSPGDTGLYSHITLVRIGDPNLDNGWWLGAGGHQ
jgi:hypothetical protein